jgi:phosphate transport system substrate-binding protein
VRAAGAVITVKGSDTMVNLCTAWAEAFMKKTPGTQAAVTGGGSGTGIAAMINKTTDICSASRKVRDVEIQKAKGAGVEFKETVVALDGISIVVNKANPVEALTLDQLHKIFNGTYKNWTEAGGPDGKIIILSRETSSGTYVYFQEEVLLKDNYAQEARLMTSNAAICEAVSQDKNAVGYCGVAYARQANVKIVPVKKVAMSMPVMPSDDAIKDGTYPISRPLFLYTNGEPQGGAKAFIDFALSEEGQKIVEEIGFVRLK